MHWYYSVSLHECISNMRWHSLAYAPMWDASKVECLQIWMRTCERSSVYANLTNVFMFKCANEHIPRMGCDNGVIPTPKWDANMWAKLCLCNWENVFMYMCATEHKPRMGCDNGLSCFSQTWLCSCSMCHNCVCTMSVSSTCVDMFSILFPSCW